MRYLKVIRKKCDEINALVNKMIVLTKSEYELSGGNESILPDEEIKNFIAENGEEYSNKGLQIDFSGEQAPQINISSAYFARLLANIADNSLKYKKGAQGRLQIELRRSDENTLLSFADGVQGGIAGQGEDVHAKRQRFGACHRQKNYNGCWRRSFRLQ